MRIKTSDAMREVDQWRTSVTMRYRRYVASLYFLLIAVGYGRQVVLPAFITVGLSVNFAAIEFASLFVLGVLLLRLHAYRFVNLFLRALTRRTS